MKSTAVGRKNFRGRLLSVSDNEIVMQVDNDQHTLTIDQIDTARVVPQF
jgi:ribosome maturation factor RimP